MTDLATTIAIAVQAALDAQNAQDSGVIVEADAPKKSPAKKSPAKKRTTAKRTTTAKKSPAKPATPPANCLTLGDIWLAMGADEDFEPSAEKIDNPAYGNWLARANHLGLLTIA